MFRNIQRESSNPHFIEIPLEHTVYTCIYRLAIKHNNGNPLFIDDFRFKIKLKPPFIRNFPLPRLIPAKTADVISDLFELVTN